MQRHAQPASPSPDGIDRRPSSLRRSGLATVSWLLLLAAVATPLLTDGPGWFGSTRGLFQSGPYLLQSYVAQLLVMGALACLAASLWTRQAGLRWNPTMGLVLGLLGWTCLATILSPSPASALLGLTIDSQGLLLRIVATAALLLAVDLVDGTARIRVAARAISVVGAAVATLGILQIAGVPALGASAAAGFGRSFGTLGNPDMFGGFIMLSLFTSFGLAVSEKTRVWRVTMWAASSVCAMAAVTSYSRAAWVGVAVGAVAFALVARKARLPIDRRVVAAVVVVVLAIGGFVALRPSAPGSATDVARRVSSAVSLTAPDTAARLRIWGTALSAVARRPIQGYGPDTMVLASEPVRTAALSRLVDPRLVMESAHSIALQTLSDLGIPGFLLWAAMLTTVAVVSWRSMLRAPEGSTSSRLLLAGMWASCAAFLADSLFTPSSVAGTLTLAVLLGLLLAPSATDSVVRARGPRRALAGALGALAVAGIVVSVPFLVADMQAAVANDRAVPEGRRIEAGASAVRLNPVSVEYAVVNASALFDAVDARAKAGTDPAGKRAYFDASLANARRAVALEPTNQRRRSFLASILLAGAAYVDKGFYTQALSESTLAVTMSPNDLATQTTFARILRSVEPAQARSVLRMVLSRRPDYAAAAIALSELDISVGDRSGARRVLSAALAATSDPADRADLERARVAIP